MLFILTRRGDFALFAFIAPVSSDFWIEVNVDFILVKYQIIDIAVG